jgi:4-hydroxy-4-methyl-2-oxoglutarate aldolase
VADGSDATAAELALPTTWVAQAGGDRVRVMTGLTTFVGRAYLCGPALTCACAPGDNLAMHAAIYHAPPGAVIVCDGGGTSQTALIGEFLATEAANRGLGGIVLEGLVRDIGDLDRLGFPVLCAGTTPAQPAKVSLLSVGQPVVVGKVLVRTGDQIVADQDGAVAVPAAAWPAVRADAAGLAGREEAVRRRLAAGERLADILCLDLAAYPPAPGPDRS